MRVLLAEFHPGLRALYPLPDQDFGQGQFATKLARGVHFGPAHLGHAPSTALRAVPLPVSGRICHRHHAAHPFFSIHAWQLPLARSRTPPIFTRSEERRVGTESVRTCRSRLSPSH